MKKLLGSTLALAMFMPAGANAEVLKNFKMSGQIDIQTTSANNVKDFATRDNGGNLNNDRIGQATTRLMLKMDWDLLDDVHSRLTLAKGAAVASGAGASRPYGMTGATGESLTTAQTEIIVGEANVKVDKLFGAVDLTMGRQFYGELGDPMIYYGPRGNFGLTMTAIDMFRADWSGEHMKVTGIAGKTTDGTLIQDGAAAAATDLRGLVLSCMKHENVKPTVYLYNQLTHATGGAGTITGKNSNLYLLGAKANITIGGLTARVEVAKNFGEDRTTAGLSKNYAGSAFYGKAGYKLDVEGAAAVTPWAEFGLGTGDKDSSVATGGGDNRNQEFKAIVTSWHPGAIYARFHNNSAIPMTSNIAVPAGAAGNVTTSQGLSNRVIWGFGVKANPAAVKQLTAGLQYYRTTFHRVAPITINGVANQTPSKAIGSEVDVTADWKHSENVTLKLTAGSFQPGKYFKDYRQGTTNDLLNPATMLAADVQIKF
ncbi:MAG TPA: hypothetical protein DCZ01_06975 [Elusimicrobia bacterium]|nr:MAG: hypothetical protein A2X37_01785 [Elusimicrobia bacterium GWA2_66_18]OGR73089.1 MAG: hypothetical protein A2X40_11990 [Elusimicrobia bacterium GWC2_65_9]HAZ08250.1 hypothetical protein [Elusimicrobiota bacterium]